MLIYLSMLPEEEDRERLAAFYEAYRELMYRTAHRVLGHHQDAEDAVHQVFLRLVRHTDRLAALKADKKAMIVTAEVDKMLVGSASNIPGVKITLVGTLNVYEILKYEKLILTKESLKKVEEVYC